MSKLGECLPPVASGDQVQERSGVIVDGVIDVHVLVQPREYRELDQTSQFEEFTVVGAHHLAHPG